MNENEEVSIRQLRKRWSAGSASEDELVYLRKMERDDKRIQRERAKAHTPWLRKYQAGA